jgi:predicted anti-sigma-YlaC factor YlaD
MKLTRKWLLRIIVALGVFMAGYMIVTQLTGHHLSETVELWMFRGIIVAALAIFVYNRKANR